MCPGPGVSPGLGVYPARGVYRRSGKGEIAISDLRGRPRRRKGVFSVNGLLSSFKGIIVVTVDGLIRLRDGLPWFSSSSCVASSVSRMRHGLTFPSCCRSFSGEIERWRPPLNFLVGEPGSMTSLNWIECALFAGLRLTRDRDRLAGVRDLAPNFPTIGDMKLWRPLNGLIGEEMRY